MKHETMEALHKAEEFFTKAINQESEGDTSSKRVEYIYYAVKGLKGIAMCKYVQYMKMKDGEMSHLLDDDMHTNPLDDVKRGKYTTQK